MVRPAWVSGGVRVELDGNVAAEVMHETVRALRADPVVGGSAA